MTAAEGEATLVAEFVEAIRLLVDKVNGLRIPRGGRLVITIAAGIKFPGEDRVNLQVSCNAGDQGLDDMIRELDKFRRSRKQ